MYTTYVQRAQAHAPQQTHRRRSIATHVSHQHTQRHKPACLRVPRLTHAGSPALAWELLWGVPHHLADASGKYW